MPPLTGLSTVTLVLLPVNAVTGKHFAFTATPLRGSVRTPLAGQVDVAALPAMGFEPSTVYIKRATLTPAGQRPLSTRFPARTEQTHTRTQNSYPSSTMLDTHIQPLHQSAIMVITQQNEGCTLRVLCVSDDRRIQHSHGHARCTINSVVHRSPTNRVA